MDFVKRWMHKSPRDQILKYSWCDEVAALDEHTSAEFVFAQECQQALHGWLKAHGPSGYQLFLPDDPIRQVEPWIKGELVWVDDWVAKNKLGTGKTAWVCRSISLEGCNLSIYRTLSGSGVEAQPETIWLCELASNPDITIASWKLGMGGYRPFSFPFSGSDNQSLLEFLLRQQARAVDGGEHNRG